MPAVATLTEPDRPAIDPDAAVRAVRDLLIALGEDPDAADLRETPRRVVAAFREFLTPRPFRFTTFPNDARYDELVLVRDIPFHSLCRHHLLPFSGVAHIGYLPGERVVGLSKLAWVVEACARGLHVQEELTTEIADMLTGRLAARGVGVVLAASHACMTLRGVAKPGAVTVTSAVRGALRDDVRSRNEFLSLVHARRP